jgi:hypothetical protein
MCGGGSHWISSGAHLAYPWKRRYLPALVQLWFVRKCSTFLSLIICMAEWFLAMCIGCIRKPMLWAPLELLCVRQILFFATPRGWFVSTCPIFWVFALCFTYIGIPFFAIVTPNTVTNVMLGLYCPPSFVSLYSFLSFALPYAQWHPCTCRYPFSLRSMLLPASFVTFHPTA